jgi:ribonuclease HI
VFFLSFFVLPFSYLPCIVLGFHMSVYSLPYIGFVDGASRNTQNLASSTWEIYAPTDEFISLHSVFFDHATNNIAEYSEVIELLTDAISFGICYLIVRLDS